MNTHERSSEDVGWLGGLGGKWVVVFEVDRRARKSSLGIHSREVAGGERTGCRTCVGRTTWSGLDTIEIRGKELCSTVRW